VPGAGRWGRPGGAQEGGSGGGRTPRLRRPRRHGVCTPRRLGAGRRWGVTAQALSACRGSGGRDWRNHGVLCRRERSQHGVQSLGFGRCPLCLCCESWAPPGSRAIAPRLRAEDLSELVFFERELKTLRGRTADLRLAVNWTGCTDQCRGGDLTCPPSAVCGAQRRGGERALSTEDPGSNVGTLSPGPW